MDRFEYVVALMSIVTGLGLADVGLSLHRLMKRRTLVRWDWLPLAVAAYLAFALIRLWYQTWTVREFPGLTDLLFFITLVVETFVLFLATAASLPDGDDYAERRVDLRAFYVDQRAYIWTLFTVFGVCWAAHGFYFMAHLGGISGLMLLTFLMPVALGVTLALVKSRLMHVVLFGALVLQEAVWMALVRF